MFEERKHLSSKTWGGSELEEHFFLQFPSCNERWGADWGVRAVCVLSACSAGWSWAKNQGSLWCWHPESFSWQTATWSSLLHYRLTGTGKFMVLFRLKMWPHQLQKGGKRGRQREYWPSCRGVGWTIQVSEVRGMHNTRPAFCVLLCSKAAGFGTDVPGVLLRQGH